jgi:hypothetical protein
MLWRLLGVRSGLGALNRYVLQWTGWRLAREVDAHGTHLRWTFVRMRPGSGWERDR